MCLLKSEFLLCNVATLDLNVAMLWKNEILTLYNVAMLGERWDVDVGSQRPNVGNSDLSYSREHHDVENCSLWNVATLDLNVATLEA